MILSSMLFATWGLRCTELLGWLHRTIASRTAPLTGHVLRLATRDSSVGNGRSLSQGDRRRPLSSSPAPGAIPLDEGGVAGVCSQMREVRRMLPDDGGDCRQMSLGNR